MADATFSGSCHCGRLTVEFSPRSHAASIVPRACGCGFCREHAAAYLSDADGRMVLTTIGRADDVYRFGLEITDFHVCGTCGVLVAATWSDRDRNSYGVVNLRVIGRMSEFTASPTGADFDGESRAGREARRRARWTPALVRTRDGDSG